jgi:membrane-associated phospholipid phosphatase
MKVVAIPLVVLCMGAAPARAQTTADHVHDVVSWGTVGANVIGDVVHTLQSPDKSCVAKREAFNVGVAVGVSELLKAVIHERRPDGSDWKSFPSEHTAIAWASAGWSVTFGYSFASGTGVERVTAHKHHWWDAAAGAALGEGARLLGPTIFRCGGTT